jgi:UDP-N-acetylmuramate--alanine ligase
MPPKKITIHFVGIGGIGVSALAQYFLAKKFKVSGSDLVSSEITKLLERKGARIKIGVHKKTNLAEKTDLLIYSPAINLFKNPETIEAQKQGIKVQSYPQALGEITKQFFTIAISGTHGKSTTASMLSLLMIKAKLDPTVIIGTKLKKFRNSNFRKGKSKYLVIEADEHFASFLNYCPQAIILTNIEADHLDYYGNYKNLLETFRKYINRLPKKGLIIANKEDRVLNKLKISPKDRKRWKIKEYSTKQPDARKLKRVLTIPGEHNLSNALAALTMARVLKIPDKLSFKALSEYQGAWRRFEEKEIKINNKKIKIISDYGHHPTEIMATIKAAREKYPYSKIKCVYQPHQYQRTYYLFTDFVESFRQAPADEIIITDVYDVAGREEEKIKEKVNSEKLVKEINRPKVFYLPKNKILRNIRKKAKEEEVVIIMGAGDIYKITLSLTGKEKKNKMK